MNYVHLSNIILGLNEFCLYILCYGDEKLKHVGILSDHCPFSVQSSLCRPMLTYLKRQMTNFHSPFFSYHFYSKYSKSRTSEESVKIGMIFGWLQILLSQPDIWMSRNYPKLVVSSGHLLSL